MKTKVCTKCKVEKELSEFHKKKDTKDGVRSQCKVCRNEDNKKYRQRPEVQQHEKEYRRRPDVREHRKQYNKEYYSQNREEIIQNHIKYKKKRYHSDLEYRISETLRSRIGLALRGKDKSASTLELIGCTVEFLKEYLASQFQEGMSWDNYSVNVWHINHIRPCSSFDLTDPQQQKE